MRCEPVCDDDGQVIAVARVSADITDEGRRALRELVEAARRADAALDAADPRRAERQAAAVERIRDRRRRWQGDGR